MRVFAHRGFPQDKVGLPGDNTLQNFAEAFEAGLDVETDVRRFLGHPVIAHDPISRDDSEGKHVNFDPEFWGTHPSHPNPIIEVVFDLLSNYPDRMMLLGLKEDGLGTDIQINAGAFGVLDQIVCFDNSVPDAVWNHRHLADLNQARRGSDYEQARGPGSYSLLDCFFADRDGPEPWLKRARGFVQTHQKTNKRPVIVVSPEIHYPECVNLWNMATLRYDIRRIGTFGVLTDYPAEWKETPDA